MTSTVLVPLLLEAVEQLDAELLRIHRGTCAVAASPGEHLATVTNLSRAVKRASRALRSVRENVLDSAAELTIDRFESAFRARTIVLQLQLQTLKQLEPQVAHRLWPASGRFQSVDDVREFLLDRIGRLNAHWAEDRRAHARDDERPGYRVLVAAVAKAERALTAIGEDSDVISFLAVGASLTCEDFRTACRVIAALLDVQLAPIPSITLRSLRAPSLARRLAPHATFSTFDDTEEDLDD